MTTSSKLPFAASTWLTINGTPLQVYEWNCTRPTYGSIGAFTATTSREMLAAAKIDLYEIGQKAYVSKGQKGQIPVHIKAQYNGSVVDLFGGELDNVEWDFDEDEVILTGRDWAGVLADILRPLAAQRTIGPPVTVVNESGSLSTTYTAGSPLSQQIQNLKPYEIAYMWAVTYGFTPKIYMTADMLPFGDIVADIGVDAGTVRTVWSELQAMARVLGWVCYVTPDHALYFGPPVTNKPPVNVSWNTTPPKGTFPSNSFALEYNPRRNQNFLVVLYSYNMATQTTSNTAVGAITPSLQTQFVNAPQINVSSGGFIFATSGANNSSSIAQIFSNYGLPVYTYYCGADLTPAQLQNDAYSMALDIAKRELILTTRIDGNPTVEPLLQVNIHAPTIPGELTKRKFYVNSIEHSFSMDDGWYTTIHGWTLPPPTGGILNSSVTQGGQVVVPQATPYKPNITAATTPSTKP